MSKIIFRFLNLVTDLLNWRYFNFRKYAIPPVNFYDDADMMAAEVSGSP
jgi:hypothetical protein